MRIVRIIARLNVGGPARHVSWLTAALAQAGHESLLVAGTVPPGEDDMSYFAAAQGVVPVIIPEMSREISPKDALTVWKLYRLLRREQPDIVHTHTAKAGTVGRVAGLLYRWLTPTALVGRPRACRFVHTYHGHVFHSYYGAAKTRIFLTIERMLARLATDRIIVISPQQFGEIHGRFGVGRAEQFTIIPLGLDTRAFAGWRERRTAARDSFRIDDDNKGIDDEGGDARGLRTGAKEGEAVVGIDTGALLVGIVGRLTEIKNHRLFLEAVARFKARYAPAVDGGNGVGRRVRFVIIGDGHLRRELEDYARELGIDAEVVFAGTRDDPENFYAALDVVVLTSLNEGTPLTLIEAMANERAVVATAVGGVVDLVGKSVDELSADAKPSATSSENKAASSFEAGKPFRLCERGVLVRSGDAEGLAEAIARLAGDEELRRELGGRGRLYVEQNYSVGRLIADVSKLYDELQERGGTVKKQEADGKWLKGEKERTSAF